MKKFIAFLMIAYILIPSVVCAESTFDLSVMSDDELIAFFNIIKTEMLERDLPLSTTQTLIAGKYIIGKDIPAGTYIITCTESVGDSLEDTYTSFGNAYNSLPDSEGLGDIFGAFGAVMGEIGMTIEVLGDFGTVIKSTSLKTGESIDIILDVGTALNIVDGTCTLEEKY